MLGLQAMSNCVSKEKDLTDEDILQMLKEVTGLGQKVVADCAIKKAKVTKEKYSHKFVREYNQLQCALKGSYDALCNTQGLWQASKCKKLFVLKAIQSLAQNVQKMKEKLAEAETAT